MKKKNIMGIVMHRNKEFTKFLKSAALPQLQRELYKRKMKYNGSSWMYYYTHPIGFMRYSEEIKEIKEQIEKIKKK